MAKNPVHLSQRSHRVTEMLQNSLTPHDID